MSASTSTKLQVESVEPESASGRSVLLPAPVPQVNVWAQRKTSLSKASEKADSKPTTSSPVQPQTPSQATPAPQTSKEKSTLVNETKSKAPSAALAKKDTNNASPNTQDSLHKAKAKFSRNEKWVPYADAEIELSSNKAKAKRPKKKKSRARGKENTALSKDSNNAKSKDNNNKPRDFGQQATTKTTNGSVEITKKSIAEKDNAEKTGKQQPSFNEQKAGDALADVSATDTGDIPMNNTRNSEAPEITAGVEKLTVSNSKAEPVTKENGGNVASPEENNVSPPANKAHNFSAPEVDAAPGASTVGGYEKPFKNNYNRNGNNYKHNKNNFKQRNYSHDNNVNPYNNSFNNGYKYNGGKNNGNRNHYPQVGNIPYPNPYFNQAPFANPFFPAAAAAAAASMGYANPYYLPNPLLTPTMPFSNQFDAGLNKFKANNGSTGYSSDRSFNDNESIESNSPSRRTSTVGPQAPLPKLPPTPQQQFYGNFAAPGAAFGQPPFYPQYAPQQFVPQIPQFIPPIPQQTQNQDPRIFAVVKQLAYYFSLENLLKDLFLRKLMNYSTGGIKLNKLLQFRRVKILIFREFKEELTKEEEEDALAILRSAVGLIDSLELIENDTEVKLKENWQQWVLASKPNEAT